MGLEVPKNLAALAIRALQSSISEAKSSCSFWARIFTFPNTFIPTLPPVKEVGATPSAAGGISSLPWESATRHPKMMGVPVECGFVVVVVFLIKRLV